MYIVVMGLSAELEEQGHCLVMDIFFGSIQLFKNLISGYICYRYECLLLLLLILFM